MSHGFSEIGNGSKSLQVLDSESYLAGTLSKSAHSILYDRACVADNNLSLVFDQDDPPIRCHDIPSLAFFEAHISIIPQ